MVDGQWSTVRCERCSARVLGQLSQREPVVVNREIQRVRRKADRKFHDGIVNDIFDNPASLNIEGLGSDSLIWKAYMYKPPISP